MEATCSSETTVEFQRTTRRYIPEDSTLQSEYLILRPCLNPGPPRYETNTHKKTFEQVFEFSGA
jgi:hypothetical protein